MKKIFILFTLIFIGTSLTYDSPTPIKKINHIFNSTIFKISIERLDFGYILNQQIYEFKKSENSFSVSQINTPITGEGTPLNNTQLNLSTSSILSKYCSSIKSFELEKSDEHIELFNNTDIHDFVYITTAVDTILLSDVHAKAINQIRNIIENNRK